MKYPWNDHQRRLSPLKLAVFVALFLPGLWVALAYSAGWFEPRPLNEAIHQIGLWTIRLIFLALLVTPLRQILQWQRLVLVRRMIGVAAFAYAATHLSLYITDQAFDIAKAAGEIVSRIYLTIGFIAVLGLAALAATSTDAMVRRLGFRRWQWLHRIVYAIAGLAVVHFCMQSKLDLWEPTIMAGLYAWLIGYRALMPLVGARQRLPLPWLALLGLAATGLTGLGEALYFHLAYGVGVMRVIDADFSLTTGLRPAVIVLGFGLAMTIAAAVRAWTLPAAKGRPRFA